MKRNLLTVVAAFMMFVMGFGLRSWEPWKSSRDDYYFLEVKYKSYPAEFQVMRMHGDGSWETEYLSEQEFLNQFCTVRKHKLLNPR